MVKLSCVVILLALCAINYSEAFSSCKVGWYLSASSGTCIKLFNEKPLSWSDARKACKGETGNTGDLIAIRDEQTNNLVSDLIGDSGIPYYIGLHDQKHEGQFVWLDDDFQAPIYFWGENQPNNMDPDAANAYDDDQDCAEIGLLSPDTWNDYSCKGPAMYICEQPAGSGYDVPCPTGWTGSASSGTCLKMFTDDYSWDDSRLKCQAGGGDLVKITDGSISKIVEALVKNAGKAAWIGLHDSRREGKFNWLDETSRRLTYNNWVPGQPNNIQSDGTDNGQDCAEIGVLSSYQWNDMECDAKDIGRICENPPSLSSVELYCDGGWTLSPTTGTCLKLNNKEIVTFDDARGACKAQGADLVRIVDPFEDSLIAGLIKAHAGAYWIGLHDRNHEGSFTWLDDLITLDYKNWARGQPNNMNEDGAAVSQDCVEIGIGDSTLWNDISCETKMNYICEKAATDNKGVAITPKPNAYGSTAKSSGLSGGATAGVVILVLILVGVLIGAGWYGYKRYTGAPVGMPESFSNMMFKFGGGSSGGADGSSA